MALIYGKSRFSLQCSFHGNYHNIVTWQLLSNKFQTYQFSRHKFWFLWTDCLIHVVHCFWDTTDHPLCLSSVRVMEQCAFWLLVLFVGYTVSAHTRFTVTIKSRFPKLYAFFLCFSSMEGASILCSRIDIPCCLVEAQPAPTQRYCNTTSTRKY